MGEAENVEIVRRFCAAWPAGDIDKLLDFFTEDAVYHNIPLQQVQGKDAIRGIFQAFTAPFERSDWEVRNIAAAGDVVLTERVDRYSRPEKPVELPVMGAFEIRDGKIAAWRDYFDLADWTRQAS